MSLRQDGIQWLKRCCSSPAGPVHVSKLYSADESWNKKPVWWFEFSESVLEDDKVPCIHLLCQLVGKPEPFAHLRVPTDWLRERRGKLHIRPEKGVSIYISAAGDTLYQELRGTGEIEFSDFVQ